MFLLMLLIAALAQKASGSTVTLDAAPTLLKKSGDTVTLTWKGLDSPSKLDWIGIYTPPTSDDDHFIGYMLLSSCPNWATGACSLQIPLVNMRAPYDFRLFRGVYVNLTASAADGNLTTILPLDMEGNPLPNTTSRLASSPHVAFANYNEPTQVHLSLTENTDEMRVMFVTRDPIRSIVKYGDDDDKLGMTVEASSWTYRISDMCDAPANTTVGWREPGYIHSALLARLKPGGRYYYQARKALTQPHMDVLKCSSTLANVSTLLVVGFQLVSCVLPWLTFLVPLIFATTATSSNLHPRT